MESPSTPNNPLRIFTYLAPIISLSISRKLSVRLEGSIYFLYFFEMNEDYNNVGEWKILFFAFLL